VCERTILGIVLAVLLWGPLAMGAVDDIGAGFGFLVIQGLTILALAVWMARFYIQRPFRLFWPPVCWAVLGFVLYAIVRCQLVEIEYPAQQLLVKIIVYAVLFFLVLHNLNRRESATAVGVTLIILGFALSAFALFQFTTHYPKVWHYFKPSQYVRRGSGTYINPDNLGGLLAMIAPVGLAYTLMGRFSATIKVLLGYCTLAMLVGLAVSISRGAILAAGCALALFCVVLLYHRDYWRRALAALVFLTGLGFCCYREFSSIERRFASTYFNGEKLFDNRLHYWTGAIEIFRRHVWWGAGPGSFPFEFPRYRSVWAQNTMLYAHNDYLNTLCEWGVAGLGIIALAVVLLYWGGVKTWPFVRKTANELGPAHSTKAAFVAGASFGLLALLLHSVVDFDMQTPANAIVAVTLMALLAAQRRFATERFWRNPGVFGKILLMGVAAGALVYLTNREVHNGRESYWLARGAPRKNTRDTELTALKNAWDTELTALKNAYQVEPANFQTCYLLGECFRILSWQGNPGYQGQARQAMLWYARSMALNPRYAYTPIRYGMCLDWLDKPDEATPYFELANQLDPNSYLVAVYEGWHCVYLNDYAGAKRWLERSLNINANDPDGRAKWYLDMVNRRIADAARKPGK
jgi:O-antigen ligase